MHPHQTQGWVGTLTIMVSNSTVIPDPGASNCPRLGDPITENDAPVSISTDAPYRWIAAVPLLYTSGLVAVYLQGSQFSRHIAP